MNQAIKLLLAITITWTLLACHNSDVPQVPAGENTPVTQKTFKWKLITTWPKNFPGLGTAPERFAKLVDTMTNGRLKIKVYGAGELVPAMEVFDAISNGTAEIGHGAGYYWKGKIPEAQFLTCVPFGLTAQEMNGWLHYGGGLELWRELYKPFGMIPMAAGNTGVQMGGWFNKEINSLEDLKGIKMRIPGLGGEVFKRAGGLPVVLPGGEIFTALQTGAIDATEWVAPYNDLAFGFHKAAKYYYYPGWHEPGPALELLINEKAFNSLPKDIQTIVRVAARDANQDMLDEYTARNMKSLDQLLAEGKVQIKPFPPEVLEAMKGFSEQVVKEQAEKSPMAKKIYKSYKTFRDGAIRYHNLTERAYVNARGE